MTHRAQVGCLFVFAFGLLYQANVLSHGTGATGANTLDWHTEVVSRVVSPESTWNNLGIGTIFSPPGNVVEIDGRPCLRGPQFNFDVSDVLAYDIDETIQVEIDFDLRDSHDTVALAYDKNGAPAGVKLVDLPASAVERIHTETISLERARFAGRGDYGTDLMLLSVGDPTANLTICDLRIRRNGGTSRTEALGWLELTIKDEDGAPTPARIGIYDESGRAPMPSRAAVQMKEFSDLTRVVRLLPATVNWPSDNRYAFYTDGHYAAAIPAGDYEIVVTKGIEYHVVRREISIAPHATNTVTVELERWADMPAEDLYSGEVHIHFPRRNEEENRSIWLQAQAEDLHVANTL
ncbi:MAG: hypothetical protein R3284_11410, partial [Rubricoccaceae bacterium]|nr:hypothetical protein [Rubricoccaceae bacterium]